MLFLEALSYLSCTGPNKKSYINDQGGMKMPKIIALDAGHGLHTAGKRTPDDEREWSFNTVVVESIIEHLQTYKKVQIVRLDDPTGKKDVPLRERTDKANQANAKILISFHHNAFEGKWGNHTGTVTFHYPSSTKGRELAKAIHPSVVEAYGLRDRGIKSANFHMLRESKMPAILIEGGFMDSLIDIKKMRKKSILQLAGKNIAEAVASYLYLEKKDQSQILYKVQIGAFREKEYAKEQAKRAKQKGFDHYIARENNFYKVQIGAFSKKSNVEHQAKKAKNQGFDVYIAQTSVEKDIDQKPSTEKVYKAGDKVKIKTSATTYATGETIPKWVKKLTHTIQQIGSNRVLLKEIYSWVRTSDLE